MDPRHPNIAFAANTAALIAFVALLFSLFLPIGTPRGWGDIETGLLVLVPLSLALSWWARREHDVPVVHEHGSSAAQYEAMEDESTINVCQLNKDRKNVFMLACEQGHLELVLAEPQTEGRHDVVFVDGIPTLRTSEAGEVRHRPWPGHPAVLPLDPPGETGQDCLRLRLRIDSDAGLIAEIHDLRSDRELPAVQLGTVR